MTVRRKSVARTATWLAFGIIALTVLSCTAHESHTEDRDIAPQEPLEDTSVEQVLSQDDQYVQGTHSTLLEEVLCIEENTAERAYRKALDTFSTIVAVPEESAPDPDSWLSSIVSFLLPSLEGQGPFASALRIFLKLSRQLSSIFDGEVSGTQQDEESYVKATKVLLLLRHSAALGNMDALFTLAAISLVRTFL